MTKPIYVCDVLATSQNNAENLIANLKKQKQKHSRSTNLTPCLVILETNKRIMYEVQWWGEKLREQGQCPTTGWRLVNIIKK